MNEDDFKRAYARIEDGVHASDNLRRATKAAIREEAAVHAAGGRPAARASATARKPKRQNRRAMLWRAAGAVCVVAAIGLGVALGSGAIGTPNAPAPVNSFTLSAYADEMADGDNARLSLAWFHPARTSAGYRYDAEHDQAGDEVTVTRYYTFDMSATGNNVVSVEYTLEGDGVSYGSWESGRAGTQTAENDDGRTFTIPYAAAEACVREIELRYVLDADEKAAFDALYKTEDVDEMETLLATCDAKRLANVTITAKATFADGSVQERSYGFEPVAGFESMYRSYLARLSDADDAWSALADEPSLFSLVEKDG